MHVQHLAAVANRQDRLRRVESMPENGLVGTVAIFIHGFCLGVPRHAITGGIDVGRAARQDESVQLLELPRKVLGSLIKADFRGFSASPSNGLEVKIQLVPLFLFLFGKSAPRNTDPRADGSVAVAAGRMAGALLGVGDR